MTLHIISIAGNHTIKCPVLKTNVSIVNCPGLPTGKDLPNIKKGIKHKTIDDPFTSDNASPPKTFPSVDKKRKKCAQKINKDNIQSGIKVPITLLRCA